MAEKLIVVRVAYDPEAKVWWIESSDLFGLHAQDFRQVAPEGKRALRVRPYGHVTVLQPCDCA